MPADNKNTRLAWIAGWGLATLVLVVGYGAPALQQAFSEPDNAMRLVRVRDMLAGQGWFDSVQHRLSPPAGVPMHWAQWIDGLLAAPVFLLTPLIGQQAAEIVVAFAWPLGLLALFMMVTVRVCAEIGALEGLKREAEWAGAIIAALAFPTIEKFAPGAFDHHNVELILGMLAVLGLIKMREAPRSGLWAGAALGLAMATAAEGLPLVVAGLMVAGVLWLVRPSEFAQGLRWVGIGLVAASAVMLPVLAPPADWFKPVCDAMGAPFLAFAVAGGGVAIALSYLPDQLNATLAARLGSSGVLGVASIAALYVLFPQCAGGSYSVLNVDVENLWISQVSEARSLMDLMEDDPSLILTLAGAAFAGLIAGAVFLKRHWREPHGWVVFAFLLSGVAVLVWQIRGATFATAFAIPFAAWAVAKVRRDYRNKASAVRALIFAGVAASSAAAAWASAGQVLQSRITPAANLADYQARTSDAASCSSPEALKSLAKVTPGVMLNHFGIGAGVLVWTKHSVIAAPYHRNIAGTMTMMNVLRSSPEAAHDLVAASPVNYVLVCSASPETQFYVQHPAGGIKPEQTLSAVLAAGHHPDWLTPVDLGASPLKLYRVVR